MIRCHPRAREHPECFKTRPGRGPAPGDGGGIFAGTGKDESVTKRLRYRMYRGPSLAPGWAVCQRPLFASLIFVLPSPLGKEILLAAQSKHNFSQPPLQLSSGQ